MPSRTKNFEVQMGFDVEVVVDNPHSITPINNSYGRTEVRDGRIALLSTPKKTYKGWSMNANRLFSSIKDQCKVSTDGLLNSSINCYNLVSDSPSLSMCRSPVGAISISWRDNTDPEWPVEIDVNDPTHVQACKMLSKTLIAYLGIPSIVYDKDKNNHRGLHTKLGEFIPRTYGNGFHGMTWFGLTSNWLNLQSTIDLVYQNTIDAFNDLVENSEIADQEYGGFSADYIMDNSKLSTIEEMVPSIIGSNYTKIRSPKYYRLRREQGEM